MIIHPEFPTHIEVHRSQIPLARVRLKIVPTFVNLCDECPSKDCSFSGEVRTCSTSADGYIWMTAASLAKFVLEGVDFKTDNPNWRANPYSFLPAAQNTTGD